VIATNAAGFLFGAILLVAARFVPQLVSALAFWLLLSALAAAFGADLIAWFLRGIRAVELDGEALTLLRGRQRSPRRIERTSVYRVRSRRRWGGRAIELRLRQRAFRSPLRGVRSAMTELLTRLLRRDRVLIRDDAFDRSAFAALAERLAAWEG
jgi:predicted membrane metal-binding protein